ncbi:MAG: NAD-dependent epimerase/dehydratase family protein [Tepidisphaeraceae bacterium]
MLVALTGASGFIGSFTARTLVSRGHKVRGLARKSTRRESVAGVVEDWVIGDQADESAIADLVRGVDVVIHNAADFEAARGSMEENLQRNIVGSLRLLDAARRAGARQFIFVSSVAVHHEILQDRKLDENHPTWPTSMYGAYKAAIEPFLKAYHHEHGINTSSWRPAAVYGIDPVLKRSQWYDLIDDARHGKTISTAKGGKITRVQDVADALALAVGDDSTSGQFYNLVDCYMYWQQAAEFAREITGLDSEIENRKGAGPRNSFHTQKAIDFFDRHGNTSALRWGLHGVRQYVAELLEAMR